MTHKSTIYLPVQITVAERASFKELVRAKGMTLSGYLGVLIKRELAKSQHEQLSADP